MRHPLSRLKSATLPLTLLSSAALLSACDDTSSPSTGEVGGVSTSGTDTPLSGVEAGVTGATDSGTTAGVTGATDAGTTAGVTGATDAGDTAGTGGRMVCQPGSSGVCVSDTERSVCDELGQDYQVVSCAEGEFCLNGACGSMRCEPGARRCSPSEPNLVLECDAEGLEWVNAEFCGREDACRAGECVSGCEAADKLNTYIGCEYWTIDLDNYPDPFTVPMPNEVPHSIVISNPSDLPAEIRFETRSGATVSAPDPIVPAGEVRAFTMPRLDVDNTSLSFNSIKVTATMPVIAYQFNPLNNDNVYSNDASLLLPTNTLGAEYLVSSWPTSPNLENIFPAGIIPQAGYFTIVATSPGETEVTVVVTADTEPGPDVPALTAGETATFTLQQFQVLNLQAAAFTPADFGELIANPNPESDLTGSFVSATQPVAVFGGHEEAVIGSASAPEGTETCCADHLEEQLLPLQTWSDEVLCVKTKPRGSASEVDVWRVISGADNNTLTTTPAVQGLNGVTLNKGEWVQVESSSAFKLTGTGPLQATQYLLSQGQTDQGTGDPSMILAVPTEQYRETYDLLVPVGYGQDWVTVIRPAGVELNLDGAPLSATFTPIAEGAWEFAYVALNPGAHNLSSGATFGVVAYGWNNAVSYGYPAGLNLRPSERGR